ncbi:small multi-drug export protein, partial [Candidatus Woesearchaeota archaeon]|nr:small multi-drug export protein [Candidatus Woesearchaeota archaeon]
MLDFLLQLHPVLYGIVISILPIGELRVGIPVVAAAMAAKTFADYFFIFLVCTTANIAAIPLIFLFLETFNKWLLKIHFYERIFHKALERVRNKSEKF